MSAQDRRIQMQEIMAEVRANHASLRDCAGPHDFQKIEDGRQIFHRYRCSKCRGEVDSQAHSWYQLGLEHGLKQATRVLVAAGAV